MSRVIFKIIFSFIILVFLQIYVLNNIQFLGYANPYLYILFILILPLETPKWLLLLMGFIMGYVIDYFSFTIGLHISATVLIAYLRPKVIHIVVPKLEPGPEVKISIKQLGFKSFLLYTGILVFVHHLVLFFVEIFKLSNFFETLKHASISSFLTILLIIIGQYLFYSKKK